MTPAERQAKFKAAHPEMAAIYNARYYEKNRERVNARNVAWREANPEKYRAQQRAWRKANPELVRANAQRWDHANRAKVSMRHAAYAAANRTKMSEIEGRRRTRALGNGVYAITQRDWNRLQERYRHACAYCGSAGTLQMEHVIPISRGGRHAIGNLVPACRRCNGSKGRKLLVEWRGL